MLIFSSVLFSGVAFAGSLNCKGTVEEIAMHGNDKFMVRLSSMNLPVFFCNPEERWTVSGVSYSTGPETCKMLYSMFLSALSADKEIDYVLFEGNAVPASCDTWVSWTSANIRYAKVKKN
ncbi:hypothetical protein KFE80_06095 [bacterium SCSIO 12696]|nr:hypothetical protein KFE80_06095 [bacterium SCSIO 12696]